ncbi:hypothetical protein ACHQM5_002703 [Ranunculus cassubicifolius]
MQDNLKAPINGVSESSNDKIEDAMWQLNIEGDEDNGESNSTQYPDRPGEPDCIYYLRTGLCGYGTNCRFNHPAYIGQLAQYSNELPERPGEPDCQFFVKTGTCKFGSTCKYHHPRDKQTAMQVPLNVYGLPMRQDEKPCPYYMRTWSCKFGIACKFHHPQPAGVGTMLPGSGPPYGSTGASVVSSSGLSYVGGLPPWSLPRAPSIPGLPLQNPQGYMPLIYSPSQGITQPQQRWNAYVGTVSPPLSSSTSTGLGSTSIYNSEPFAQYPERPEQPECVYYMKTGRCKFGSDCKYHHPKDKLASLATSDLVGPFGLPFRPGQPICSNYSMYGVCKFGSSCKFDHPYTGFYNYGPSMPPTVSIVNNLPDTPAPPKSPNSSDDASSPAADTVPTSTSENK